MLWEQATHVPLIVADERFSSNAGTRCDQPVSLLDLYPTLADLCGHTLPAHLEGQSLKPLLLAPNTTTDRVVVTTYQFNNHSMRSKNWRYIRYADGSEELYDHRSDSAEQNNLAADDTYTRVKERLAGSLPTKNARQKNLRATLSLNSPNR